MAIYAKINKDGSVEQFPYFDPSLDNIGADNTLPENVVEVDTESNKPATNWDQVLRHDTVTKSGDSYIVTYTVSDRYEDASGKSEGIKILKSMAEVTNERTFVQKAKELSASYSESEKESWTIQRAEAQEYSTDNSAPTPLLTAVAEAQGITTSALVDKVLTKVDTYNTAYGALLGEYKRNQTILSNIDLNDETTWDIIEQVTWR